MTTLPYPVDGPDSYRTLRRRMRRAVVLFAVSFLSLVAVVVGLGLTW